MLNLAAIKDRGLCPTFEDVLIGLKAALDHTGSEDSEERQAIYAIETACRKRQVDKSKRWKIGWGKTVTIAPGWHVDRTGDTILRDKTGHPVQPQNPNP